METITITRKEAPYKITIKLDDPRDDLDLPDVFSVIVDGRLYFPVSNKVASGILQSMTDINYALAALIHDEEPLIEVKL